MQTELSYRLLEGIKKTGIRMTVTLEEIEKIVLLTAFKVIFTCTSLALDRFSQDGKPLNN